MNKSILNRAFSTREKVLILILAILMLGATYYYLIINNVETTKINNQEAMSKIDSELVLQQAIDENFKRMNAELDRLGDISLLPVVPVYDNFKKVLDELNSNLAGTISYNLSFSDPELDEKLIRRTVEVSFVCDKYESALDIITSMENSPYMSNIDTFAITPRLLANGDVVNVLGEVTITYFETSEGADDLAGVVVVD